MGIREDLAKYRAQGRERRMALIEAEDAAAFVKKEKSPPTAVQPKYDLLQAIGTTYSDLKPAKKRKASGNGPYPVPFQVYHVNNVADQLISISEPSTSTYRYTFHANKPKYYSSFI